MHRQWRFWAVELAFHHMGDGLDIVSTMDLMGVA
jgi:hypothetical protein